MACPDPVVAYVAPGVTSTRVTWPPANASDNSGIQPILTSTPARNAVFTQGLSVVTYTATDQSGNRATCTFSVNVLGELIGCHTIKRCGSINTIVVSTDRMSNCFIPSNTFPCAIIHICSMMLQVELLYTVILRQIVSNTTVTT